MSADDNRPGLLRAQHNLQSLCGNPEGNAYSHLHEPRHLDIFSLLLPTRAHISLVYMNRHKRLLLAPHIYLLRHLVIRELLFYIRYWNNGLCS